MNKPNIVYKMYNNFTNTSSQIKKAKIYYLNEQIHRENGPAIIRYSPEGKIIQTEYYWYGKKHRNTDSPTVIQYSLHNKGSSIACSFYYINNNIHRDNGPAIIIYSKYPEIEQEIYYCNGVIHRKNGPAVIEYSNKKIKNINYIENGQLHRAEGPAHIKYLDNQNGNTENQYYFRGKRIPDWVPKIENKRIEFDKSLILKVILKFDREYGLLLRKLIEVIS